MQEAKRKFPVLAVIAVILAVLAAGMLFLLLAPAPRMHWALTMGEKYLTQGDYEQAVTMFTRAIQVDDRAEAAYLGRAEAYTQLGENEAAEADLTFVIDELGTEDAQVYLTRAAVYDALQQPEKAQADRDAAQKLGCDAPDANTDADVVEVTPTPEPTPETTATPQPTRTLSVPVTYDPGYFQSYMTYKYNADLTLIERGNHGITTFDDHGNPVKSTYNDGSEITYDNVYDTNGNLTQVTRHDSDGQTYVTSYTYDEHGNETSSRESDGSYSTTTNSYDVQGRLINSHEESHSEYMDSVTDKTYEFRSDGYTEKLTIFGGESTYTETEYTLDGVPVKKTLFFGEADSSPWEVTTYNENGCPVTFTEYNDDSAHTVLGTGEYTYDADGRLLSHSYSGGYYDPFYISYNYTYDVNGNVVSRQAVQDGTVTNTLTYELFEVPGDYKVSSFDTSKLYYIQTEDLILNP